MPTPKNSVVAFVVVASFALTACSATTVEEASGGSMQPNIEVESSTEPDGSVADVEVDEGLLAVEITIPKEFFEDATEADIVAGAEESTFTSAVINDDGSVTYTMPRAVHNDLLQDMVDGIDETIAEALRENPGIITEVTYNTDVTRFLVTVNQSAYESSFEASFIGFGLGLSGLFYQIFKGVAIDDREVIIDFIDDVSGEVIDSQRWPGEE